MQHTLDLLSHVLFLAGVIYALFAFHCLTNPSNRASAEKDLLGFWQKAFGDSPEPLFFFWVIGYPFVWLMVLPYRRFWAAIAVSFLLMVPVRLV